MNDQVNAAQTPLPEVEGTLRAAAETADGLTGLLPCPKCRSVNLELLDNAWSEVQIRCKGCGIRTCDYSWRTGIATPEAERQRKARAINAAIASWNTRAVVYAQGWIDTMKQKPPMQRFVSGQGRVPSKPPYVLAVDLKGRMSVGYATPYSNPDDGYRWTFAKPIGEPTHWMPLPKPPA